MMDGTPLVSVIVPVRNAEDSVRLLLDSLAQLDYPQSRLEVILVDNGSTDGTRAVISEYPVVLLEEATIRSSYAARNRAVARARGDILAFTDSDCIVTPGWIREGVRVLTEQGVDLVGGRVEFFLSSPYAAAEIFDAASHMSSETLVTGGQGATTANLFVPTAAAQSIGPFPNSVRSGGDMIWTRAALRKGFRLAYATDAVVRHPARNFRELLRKAFRVGTGAPRIERSDNGSQADLLKGAIRSVLPSGPGSLRRRLHDHGFDIPALTFLRVWLVSYGYGLTWAVGVLFAYVREIAGWKGREDRHTKRRPDMSAAGTVSPRPIMFSAVIPTHNRARLVARAIQSALDQSFRPAEIIVVDDGSTDATEDSVRQFGNTVRYVRQENSGGASARNRGVRESTQEWVAFLDSDDVWTTTHLERIAQAIDATNGGAIVYFDDMAVPDKAEPTWWGVGGFQISQEHVIVPDGADWVLREFQPMMLQSSVCRRSVILEEGGLWEKLRNAHDTHFFLKLGIGRPMCAVGGIGCRQTADAPGILRLTSATLQKRRFLNRTLAFRDILARKSQLTTSQRSCLRQRIASSFWTLGRIAWEEKKPLQCFAFVLRAVMTDLPTAPLFAVRAIRNRLVRTSPPHGAA